MRIKTGFIIFFALLLTIFTIRPTLGQKVGLVLSGGGAKGLYHIGVIKAFEENGIPIDYISGASQGAIVGAMYAAGYSPDYMIRFFSTDSVQTWLTGKFPEEHNYYFKRYDPKPEMVSVRVNPDTTSLAALRLPTNLIAPYSIDLAFTNMLQGASAASADNFDSLMVPFRCVASDVYHKKLVTFREGDLSFAVRASMSIPLVFKPLERDSTLLYDGGVLNNFPWQTLQEDFAPDVLIGSVCVGDMKKPSADNITQQLFTLITTPTDYALPAGDSALMIRRVFPNVSTLDYNKAVMIMEKGYMDAMQMMPRIQQTIKRRVSKDEMERRRHEFLSKVPQLLFEEIQIDGLTPSQTAYVKRQLGMHLHSLVTVDYFEERYMKILATGIFSGEFPEVQYNPETKHFKLRLRMKTQPSLKVSLGGNLSSTALNQLYLGLTYQRVGEHVSTYGLNGYLGTFYNSFLAEGRHDFYTNFPFYVNYSYQFETFNRNTFNSGPYYRNQAWRYENQTNNLISASIAAPFLNNAALRARLALGTSDNTYFTTFHTSADSPDNSTFTFGRFGIELESQNSPFALFQHTGRNQLLRLEYVNGLESYRQGSVYAKEIDSFSGRNRNWVELSLKHEHYVPTRSRWFTFGYLFQAGFSTLPSFANPYMQSMMAPSFSPTFLSQTLFMPEYTSQNFLAVGIIPVFNIIKDLYVKSYAYMFVPQRVIYNNGWIPIQDTWKSFNQWSEYIFGGSIVYQTPIGPASLTVEKYTTGPKNWNIVFNFGYTLFTRQ